MADCPDTNTFAGYVEGSLPPSQQARLDAHFDGCDACRRELSALAGSDWLTCDGTSVGAREVSTVRVGQVLASKYQIERVIGVGGMGFVVAARHLRLQQRVAIKLLFPDAVERSDSAARLVREARSAAALTSPYVCRVLDVDTLPSGQPYIVMEYLDGEDLEAIVARRGAIPLQEAVEYLLQACHALAEAHGRGIVHRDIKPANLFLARDPNGMERVRVVDFGVAKTEAFEGEERVDTAVSTLLGSPAYMAPEQIVSARRADARADVWALGAVLYQLLSGRRPFTGGSSAAVLGEIMCEPPQPLGVAVPDEIERAIFRCLDKDPARRFAQAGELATALLESRRRADVRRWRRRMVGFGLAGTLLGGATIVVGSLLSRAPAPTPAPTPAPARALSPTPSPQPASAPELTDARPPHDPEPTATAPDRERTSRTKAPARRRPRSPVKGGARAPTPEELLRNRQ